MHQFEYTDPVVLRGPLKLQSIVNLTVSLGLEHGCLAQGKL